MMDRRMRPMTGSEEVIAGATSATYTPTNDDIVGGAGRYLRAIATYTDPQGKDNTSNATSAAVVTLQPENAPKFEDDEDGIRSIREDKKADDEVGTLAVPTANVGAAVQATDADAGQLLTYRLSGADASSFTITSDITGTPGGQIAVKAGTKLDYDTKSTYRVTVTATDPDNLSASIDVTIMVIDVNEAPEVTGDAEKDYPENQIRDVATYRATDPEGGTIYWSLLEDASGIDDVEPGDRADFDDFSISAAGVLTFNIPPDHESEDDEGTNNVYNIVVVASDDAPGATGERMGYKKVVVTVTDVDEPGMVTLSSLQPQIDVGLTADPTDPEVPDIAPGDVTWKWEKSRSRTSGWTALGGTDAAIRTPDATTTGYYLRGDGDL